MSKSPKVQGSQGPKDQDISKSHSNSSLTLKKVHLVYIENLSFVSKRHIFGPKNQPRRFFQNFELNAAGIYKSYTIFCNPMIFCGSIQILHRKIYIGVEKLAWK